MSYSYLFKWPTINAIHCQFFYYTLSHSKWARVFFVAWNKPIRTFLPLRGGNCSSNGAEINMNSWAPCIKDDWRGGHGRPVILHLNELQLSDAHGAPLKWPSGDRRSTHGEQHFQLHPVKQKRCCLLKIAYSDKATESTYLARTTE